MSFERTSLTLLVEAAETLERQFGALPTYAPDADLEAWRAVLIETAERLGDNFPYQHPLYVGQMLKPPHPIARLAYALSMFINPNNHALDGGRASSRMEKEAVSDLARMFGWSTHLGHLCGGGTMANLEALWVAREVAAKPVVVASSQAHYTHARLSSVLGVPFRAVSVDARGRMDIDALEHQLQQGDVGVVVATLGTTSCGAVDPLSEIVRLRARYPFRLHVDAAYGGYFTLASNLPASARDAFDHIPQADSIVIDPHKHGLQPYGCGCVLFKDPAVGRVFRHDSPYTYFSSDELHLGEISLECSRPGASAVALWATMRLLPLEPGGQLATWLDTGHRAALELHRRLESSGRFVPLFSPELDIVAWVLRAARASDASALARATFDRAAEHNVHLALATFPRAMVEPIGAIEHFDEESVTCLRACVMKPEHEVWLDEISSRLGL